MSTEVSSEVETKVMTMVIMLMMTRTDGDDDAITLLQDEPCQPYKSKQQGRSKCDPQWSLEDTQRANIPPEIKMFIQQVIP